MKKTVFERGQINQIRIHVLPTKQFKTYAISVYMGKPLSEEWVTPIALIPFVLRRGTMKYPETIQFREHLDDLYGAGFGFDIYKRGDYQIVQFRMDIINDQFVSEANSLLSRALHFLGETLTDPVREGGHFRNVYVDSEKITVQKKLESIINDKIKYAAERCIEEMCANEPYRFHPLGKINDIKNITSDQLYSRYEQWLSSVPIDIYVVGDTSLAEVTSLVESAFQIKQADEDRYSLKATNPPVTDVKRIVEQLDVSQGKLNMGLRTYVTYADDDYPAALLYNGIFGGYPHSKLFTNVREKASLAYYASSRLDGHKGILTIQSGIEMNNYDQAVDIILKQLEAMKDAVVSDLEINQTKAMIINQLRESQDSAFEMISLDFNNTLSGRERTSISLIEDIQRTDLQAVQHVAEKVKLDTIYFLRNRKEEA